MLFPVLKLLKTAEGIRKLLDTVAEALPQVSHYDENSKILSGPILLEKSLYSVFAHVTRRHICIMKLKEGFA